MPTTPNMLLVLPTENGDDGDWDVKLNTALTRVDAHDHTTSLGTAIPTEGIALDADLTFGDFAATDVKAVTLTPITAAAMASYAAGLFVNSSDGELYYHDALGNNAKMTADGVLNVAALAGGIGGDYVAVSALVSFDDASNRYLFQQQGSPRPWAGLAGGNLDLYEQAPSIVNRVRLRSPSALAGSYEVVFPAALPAARGFAQLDASGNLSVQTDNELPSNQSIKLTGTGKLKRDAFGASFPLDINKLIKAGGTVSSSLGTAGVTQDASVTAYYELPPVDFEEAITAVTIRGSGASAALTLMEYDPASGSSYSVVAGTSGIAFTAGAATLTPTTPAAAAGKVYVLRVVTSGGGSATLIGGEYLRKVA